MSLPEEYNYFEDEEEIDIVKLVSTNANDSNQYLLFIGQDDQYYAKNVSKIDEIVVYKSLDIVRNYDENLVLGVADIRGEMLVLVNFDTWLCGKEHNDDENEFVIVVNYGGERFGLVVKGVDSIITIETKEMYATGAGNNKSAFTSKIQVNNKSHLCTVIDSDKMLLETFEKNEEKTNHELTELVPEEISDKVVLFADDSKLIQRLIHKVATKLNLNYKVFDDGKALLDELKSLPEHRIGLVVTDLEMPILGGKEVLSNIRNNTVFDALNVVIHSNMANEVMQKELSQLGANDIICKVDIPTLSSAIKTYIR